MEQTISNLLTDDFSGVEVDFDNDKLSDSANGGDLSNRCRDIGENNRHEGMWTRSEESTEETHDLVSPRTQEDDIHGSDDDEVDQENIVLTEQELCGSSLMNDIQGEDEQVFDQRMDEDTLHEERVKDELEASAGSSDNVSLETEENMQSPTSSDVVIEDQSTACIKRFTAEGSPHILYSEELYEERARMSEDEESEKEQEFINFGQTNEHYNTVGTNIRDLLTDEQRGDDIREFSEEDQERTGEDLADYPSDLSQPEDKEYNLKEEESFTDEFGVQTRSLLIPSNTSDSGLRMTETAYLPNEMREFPVNLSGEGLQEEGSDTEGINRNTHIENLNEDESSDFSTNDQPEYETDISSENSSTNQEDPLCTLPPNGGESIEEVRHDSKLNDEGPEWDHRTENIHDKSHGNNLKCASVSPNSPCFKVQDSKNMDSDLPSDDQYEQKISSELHPSESALQHTEIKEQNVLSQDISDMPGDIVTSISGEFWSSAYLEDFESKLELDGFLQVDPEYQGQADSDEELLGQTEAVLDEKVNDEEDQEEEERNWELDRARIEAFYSIDLTSTDEDVNTELKYEDQSESDEFEERTWPHEQIKTLPKEQKKVVVTLETNSQCQRCCGLLKTALTLSLLLAVGLVSFWWVTDELDWMH
ncbi:RNA polymerase-associated protein LEO1 [Chanos chanos]|uniref:RNA polymerase-associated protein LEO1 n=1 Tax=Chanos chanos TaxID=29144 RepID=A0A6J2WA04_CHACN|nr:RNA polymerase-associated protein LEO1-like [Chanos chanos]